LLRAGFGGKEMRDVFEVVARCLQSGIPLALGTLVETRNSSPAPLGTAVAVYGDGAIAGNIGAGCYEGEIVEACLETLIDGEFRTLSINLESTDEITGSSGCGGALRIAVWRPGAGFFKTASALAFGSEDVALNIEGYRVEVPAKRPLFLIGATTLAQEIAQMARALDFFVTVVDPRPAFATNDRIPDADALVVEWPDAHLPGVLDAKSAIVVLSHDPKFDIPALQCALQSDAWYIGLLGSRRSQAARRQSLREAGFDDAQLARIHGPVGLDLGGVTTGETAVSILGHIVAMRSGHSASALDTITGSIHETPARVSS
jgi:xanthine dehydrogenase accessory factor